MDPGLEPCACLPFVSGATGFEGVPLKIQRPMEVSQSGGPPFAWFERVITQKHAICVVPYLEMNLQDPQGDVWRKRRGLPLPW